MIGYPVLTCESPHTPLILILLLIGIILAHIDNIG